MAGETSWASLRKADAALLAGVLAAAEAALPRKGLDLLVLGASRRGDQATLQYLLANDGGATWTPSKQQVDDGPGDNGEGNRPCVSSSRGSSKTTKGLMNSGAGVDIAESGFGATPLCLAAEAGKAGVVDVLLKAGMDVNTTTNDGATPLLLAAKEGHEYIVEQLLKAGADPDGTAMDDGTTPLIAAIWNGNLGVVEQLLESGANVDKQRTDDGSSPLLVATMKGRDSIVEQLIEAGADFNKARTDDGTTPLLMAAGQGNGLLVERLLRSGADVNKSRTDDGSTALGMAAMDGNERIATQLIKAGADIVMESGESTLTLAAWEGHIGVCSLLLEAGADINHVSETGETPLNVAVREDRCEIALFLLANGASSAGGIVDKKMRQKLAKWLVQDTMRQFEAMDEPTELPGRRQSNPGLKYQAATSDIDSNRRNSTGSRPESSKQPVHQSL